jgi:hypothetical protein
MCQGLSTLQLVRQIAGAMCRGLSALQLVRQSAVCLRGTMLMRSAICRRHTLLPVPLAALRAQALCRGRAGATGNSSMHTVASVALQAAANAQLQAGNALRGAVGRSTRVPNTGVHNALRGAAGCSTRMPNTGVHNVL